MSRRQQIAIIVAAALIVGCGSSGTGPDGTGNTNTSTKVLTATINGTAFTATTVSGAYFNGTISINGSSNQRSLTISAIGLNGPGTYSLTRGNPNSALAQVIGDAAAGTYSTGFGGAGSIKLTTAVLGHIKGTFTFTAYTVNGGGLGQPVVTVQNGTFDITNP